MMPTLFDLGSESTATFSPCRTYRYTLTRRWGDGPTANFLMLNPSTADETNPDPTVTRCLNFARAWGCGRLVVTNLFALRSTDPRGLYKHADPVGPDNDAAILAAAQGDGTGAGVVVAAWGVHGAFRGRGEAVAKLLSDAGVAVQCLARTAAGHPGHPLYLKASLTPFSFAGPTPAQTVASSD